MKRRDGQLVEGSVPLRGGLESRLPGSAAVASGNYYRAESPAAGFPALQRGPLLPQQQLLRRQQARGVQQQQQPLPPLEGDKNVITLYHSVITATIQRCAQLQNAKVLDAIERHWRMALQRRTAELRRSSGTSVSVPTRSSAKGDNQQQQQSRPVSNIGTSSRSSSSRTSSASAAEPTAPEQQQKRERRGTAVEAVVSNGGSNTLPSAAAAVEQKQEQGTSVKIKTETITAEAPKISWPQGNTLEVKVKQEQPPTGVSAGTTDAARGKGGGAAASESNAMSHSVQEVREEDDDDDEFADADVDEAKPAAEAAESAAADREEAVTTEVTGSNEKAKQTSGDATAEGAAAARDAGVQAHELAGAAAAKAAKEHADSKCGQVDFSHYKHVEPLDFEQPESLDDVSDIDDQEPPTTDGIFALYEKVQRCGSSGRKATNWKVTLRHGIIRAAHQEIAFDRLHAELRF